MSLEQRKHDYVVGLILAILASLGLAAISILRRGGLEAAVAALPPLPFVLIFGARLRELNRQTAEVP
jgi:hypothetical protein